MSATHFLPLLASKNEGERRLLLAAQDVEAAVSQKTGLSSGAGDRTHSIFICARRHVDGTVVVNQVQ
jgi:hypothetical protein